MKKFYSDNYVKRIPVKDVGDPLVDVTKYVKRIIVRKNNTLKRKDNQILIRRQVAEMLRNAQQYLPDGYSFFLYDGFREEKIQKVYFKNHLKNIRAKHPDWPEEKLRAAAAIFVADPSRVCPHLTGGAVDISVGKKKRIATGGFNHFDDRNISPLFQKKRKFLATIMEKAGFVNYEPEWWHWSYGDRYWAAVMKKEYAIYGEIRK